MDVLTLATPPAVEPVALADAKAHLRLEITADDALVSGLITAARMACETELRQSFVATGWVLNIDGFPGGGGYYNRTVRQMGEGPMWLPQAGGGIFVLPQAPLISVQSISYIAPDNSSQTINPSIYRVVPGKPGRVQPVFGMVWPIAAPIINAVQIAFTAGYGTDPTLVPAPIQLAIKLLVAHYYEDREAVGTIPEGIGAILSASDHGSYA